MIPQHKLISTMAARGIRNFKATHSKAPTHIVLSEQQIKDVVRELIDEGCSFWDEIQDGDLCLFGLKVIKGQFGPIVERRER